VDARFPITMLQVQYRMHPILAEFPSQQVCVPSAPSYGLWLGSARSSAVGKLFVVPAWTLPVPVSEKAIEACVWA
jgi:hypothetical protein